MEEESEGAVASLQLRASLASSTPANGESVRRSVGTMVAKLMAPLPTPTPEPAPSERRGEELRATDADEAHKLEDRPPPAAVGLT